MLIIGRRGIYMSDQSISEFVASCDNSQSVAAKKLGVTPGAVCQMLASSREIYVRELRGESGDITYQGYAIKPIGQRRSA
jgi:hypothetical protein